jgi:hypothetical protein
MKLLPNAKLFTCSSFPFNEKSIIVTATLKKKKEMWSFEKTVNHGTINQKSTWFTIANTIQLTVILVIGLYFQFKWNFV